MSFLASIFGTILYFIYNIVNNYGFAIILFSVLLKIVLGQCKKLQKFKNR